jgi:type VI secretion system protein ImpC
MIELDVETRRKTAIASSEVASFYLILGDFGGRSGGPAAVDRDNLDGVLARQAINLAGSPIREIEDFHPDRLYQRLEVFHDLREDPAEETPASARSPKLNLAEILKPSSLLEQIAGGGDPFEQYVRDLAQAHAAPPAASDRGKTAERAERMRALLRHPRFQTLEAAWRGLDFVTRQMEDESSRIHIAQFSKQELADDILETADLKATRMYALLRTRAWRAVFGLYSFGPSPADVELLGRIALLAANARTVFIAEGSADMGPNWEELRSIPEAKHLGLMLPRFLLRLPYGRRTSAIDSFEFEEMPGVPVHSAYLWGHPAFVFLSLLTRDNQEDDDDFDLKDLPLHSFQEEGEWKATPCAEILMSETEVRALMELGLMPLVSFRDSNRVRLAGVRAINGQALPMPRPD